MKSKTMIIAGVGIVALLAVSYFFLLPMLKGKPADAESGEEGIRRRGRGRSR